MNISLREHQEESLRAIISELKNIAHDPKPYVEKALIVAPTGAGKTITMLSTSYLLLQNWKWKSLIVVPSKTLINQTVAAAKALVPDWKVGRIGGGKTDATPDHDLVVATVQALKPDSLKKLNLKAHQFPMIFIDEAHHQAAATYQEVWNYFNRAKLVVGLTATFIRGDGVSIATADFYPKIIAYSTIGQLTERGYLVPATGHLVYSGQKFDFEISRETGDFNKKQLELVNNPERNQLIVDAWKDFGENARTIIFGVSINHAKAIAEAFRANGIPAAAISGKTDNQEQKEILDGLRDGSIKVVTNCQMLTEGFDEPRVGCVMIARPATPTSLCVLAPQMIGRGLRTHPESGKKHAVIIEIRDQEKKDRRLRKMRQPGDPEELMMSAMEAAFGCEAGAFDEDSQKPLHEQAQEEEKNQLQKERERLLHILSNGANNEQGLTEMFDIIEQVSVSSILAWIPLGNSLFLNLGNGDFADITPEGEGFVIRLAFNAQFKILGRRPDQADALRYADNWLRDNMEMTNIQERTANWRNKVPSPAQIEFAHSITKIDKERLAARYDRGQLSDLIACHQALKNQSSAG